MKIQCFKQDEPNFHTVDWDNSVEVEVAIGEEETALGGEMACQQLYSELSDAEKAKTINYWWRRIDRPSEYALWSHSPEVKDLPKADEPAAS